MFSCHIKTDNDAFAGDNRNAELARILREIADRLESGHTSGRTFDANGNRAGQWSLGNQR